MNWHTLNKMTTDRGSTLGLIILGKSETWPLHWPLLDSDPQLCSASFTLDSVSFLCLPPLFTSPQSFLMSSSKLMVTEQLCILAVLCLFKSFRFWCSRLVWNKLNGLRFYQKMKAKLSCNKTENRNSKNQFTIIYPFYVSYIAPW